MNIDSNTIHASIPCICILIYSYTNCFLTKSCVGGGSIQKCVLIIQIESSIYKLVQLNLICVTLDTMQYK